MSLSAQDISFRWNGKTLSARQGDTLSAALWRAGVTTFARSRKLHRPLSYSGAHTVGVLAKVDGMPNVRMDQIELRPGMQVSMQNCWPAPGFDLLKALQILPSKLVYGGFEHGALIPQAGLPARLAERAMALLAGVADVAPVDWNAAPIPGTSLAPDLLVVGGGPEGIRAANAAAASGESVALITRGESPGRFAVAAGETLPSLSDKVQLFLATEVFGAYRDGRVILAAPVDGTGPAMAIRPGRVVLATGRRSMPPMVRGNHLPGVFDAHAALDLAARFRVLPGKRVAVVGTGSETRLAARLKALGCKISHCGPVSALEKIEGGKRVKAIRAGGKRITCDALIHAGPWRSDPNLAFQISAEGAYQLLGQALPGYVSFTGAAALPAEAIPVPAAPDSEALICPCMDVTAGELTHHIDAGETDPEVLKRLTSCGMGTCQGWPCWEGMLALLAARTGLQPDDFARPSHRPPRRAITIAQAAGLSGLVEVCQK